MQKNSIEPEINKLNSLESRRTFKLCQATWWEAHSNSYCRESPSAANDAVLFVSLISLFVLVIFIFANLSPNLTIRKEFLKHNCTLDRILFIKNVIRDELKKRFEYLYKIFPYDLSISREEPNIQMPYVMYICNALLIWKLLFFFTKTFIHLVHKMVWNLIQFYSQAIFHKTLDYPKKRLTRFWKIYFLWQTMIYSLHV